MSLRRRLLITLVASLCLLWFAASAWMLFDLDRRVRDTLDQRLVASAHMVAGLLSQVPESTWQQTVGPQLSSPPGAGVACQIRSMRGDVLLRTRGNLASVLNRAPPGFSERSRNGQRWRLYTEFDHGLAITVADRLDERRHLQWGIVLAAAVPFVLALLGSLIAVWWSISRGLAPLERLRRELARRNPETLTPIVVESAPAELQPVIATLNHLLDRTAQVLAREQRFTSDAAHELRTPLTAIKTHVQLAARADGQRARQALVDAEAGIARLQHTLEQLLLLARIENDQSDRPVSTAAVSDVIAAALADLGEQTRVQVGPFDAAAEVVAPLALTAGALRNLLENACRHTPAGQPITLDVERRGRNIVFIVRDCGDWPADADPDALIPRFARQGIGRAHGGSGLGLAIAAAVAERFGGGLALQARPGGGLQTELSLPATDTDQRRLAD